MDLTSASLALRSLERRGVSDSCVVSGKCLLEILEDGANGDPSVALRTLLSDRDHWESRAAGFCAATEIMMKRGKHAECLAELMYEHVGENLEDREPRLRECVVKVLGCLAEFDGSQTWEKYGTVLCDIVDKSFDLDHDERAETHNLIAQQAGVRKGKSDPITSLIHETIGWKALETSMRGLESLVRGYGETFARDGRLDWKDNYLMKLVSQRALTHENRYIREVGYDLCAELASVVCKDTNGERNAHTDAIAKAVQKGLGDNWSQVRFAASVATRNLMKGLKEEARSVYYPELIPRMCLNRYYLAEGVRIYSQETWCLCFKDNGPAVVESQIGHVVEFYCAQSGADNHGVREAACHCISEVSAKIRHQVLAPYVDILLSALLDCFKDDSWPVRDAACVATGKFVLNYPEESTGRLEELFTLWFSHLSDNIWSVREDSAIALGCVMRAYPELGVERVVSRLPDLLAKVHDQKKHVGLHERPSGVTEEQFSELNREYEDDPPIAPPRSSKSRPRGVYRGNLKELQQENIDSKLSNQQMYSCGSLAPKLKRRGVGCMDHGFSRPKKDWEITDGAVYLLRELALLHPEKAEAFMPALASASTVVGIENSSDLQATIWKQLIQIAKALGKRPFKRYMEPFLPPLVASLKDENQLTASAAAECLSFLIQYLGQGIMKGRVESLLNGHNLWEAVATNQNVVIPNQE
mmetsp:Transcript_6677/g.11786  ORF Transcript_6677/g.11786 Transcript_6677/m.11786 type:complete len:700 (+) Transcript_6677:78-2177(+)